MSQGCPSKAIRLSLLWSCARSVGDLITSNLQADELHSTRAAILTAHNYRTFLKFGWSIVGAGCCNASFRLAFADLVAKLTYCDRVQLAEMCYRSQQTTMRITQYSFTLRSAAPRRAFCKLKALQNMVSSRSIASACMKSSEGNQTQSCSNASLVNAWMCQL